MSQAPANDLTLHGSILLVDDNYKRRSLRAIMLSTHGYKVDSVSSSAEAHLSWEATRPDLVLVAFSRYHGGTLEFLEKIKRVNPQQRAAFVNGESHLSPLFYNGELVRKAEGPEDLIEQVRALLASL